MNTHQQWRVALRLCALLVLGSSGLAEEHRATHLGSPEGRFADPLVSEKDLRWRFRDERLRPDFITVLNQWEWPGRPADLFEAAAGNPITEVKIVPGTVMPFMSSRVKGKPVCLRNVLWAGEQPVSAYAFEFTSRGRQYRCVTPKPCSNFFLEDMGPEPKPVLSLECTAPEKSPVGRNLSVCLTLRNTGNAGESNLSLTLPLPPATTASTASAGGVIAADRVQWDIGKLGVKDSRQVCVTLRPTELGSLPTIWTASGSVSTSVKAACATEVFGIPAILLEKADDPDPVAVGDTTTFTVKVTNQGTAADHNVQIVVTIAPELVPVSSTEGAIDGQTVTFPKVSSLASKQLVTYQIVARGVQAGDGHTKFTLTSDVLKSPIAAEESTTVY